MDNNILASGVVFRFMCDFSGISEQHHARLVVWGSFLPYKIESTALYDSASFPKLLYLMVWSSNRRTGLFTNYISRTNLFIYVTLPKRLQIYVKFIKLLGVLSANVQVAPVRLIISLYELCQAPNTVLQPRFHSTRSKTFPSLRWWGVSISLCLRGPSRYEVAFHTALLGIGSDLAIVSA